jgi:hypothetical protein
MKIIRGAHGANLMEDDHFGKRALPDRSGFDLGPTDGQADTLHVRYLMLQENARRETCDMPGRFSYDDIKKLRHHGAKCTFTSCAQYLQHKGFSRVSKAAVRNQGGWKAKGEDAMPDTYLRSKQLLSLELQESCLQYIRKYGELDYNAEGIPVNQDDLPEATVPEDTKFDFSKEGLSTPDLFEDESTPAQKEENPISEGESQGDPSKAGQEEECQQDNESSSSFSSSVEEESGKLPESEVESSDEDAPVLVQALLCHSKTFTYHLPDEKDPSWSSCRRAKQNLASKSSGTFCNWRKSFLSIACSVCFPIPSKMLEPCIHICGLCTEEGICTNRCKETNNSGHDLHDCFEHGRAPKRAKVLSTDTDPEPPHCAQVA